MSDFSDAAEKVADLRRNLREEHQNATEESMDEMGNRITQEVRFNDSVARENLVNDIHSGRASGQDTFVAQRVHAPDWAKFVEYGTGQRAREDTLPEHKSYRAPNPLPPYQPILTWVIEKGIIPNTMDSQYELAKAIQIQIGNLGTYPHPFMRSVWYGPKGFRAVTNANEQAIERALRRSF